MTMEPVLFPGNIGETICLPCKGAVSTPTSDEPPFQVGDICDFPPFDYRFRITHVDGDDVYFKRIS